LPADLSDDELAVIRAINENEETAIEGVHIDAIGRTLGWTPGKVSQVLLSLEVQGLVMQFPGMRYSTGA
jgi:predicted Rossmann fold nucleotide-binding protein DprA/Smf involved in DNA uptake